MGPEQTTTMVRMACECGEELEVEDSSNRVHLSLRRYVCGHR